MADAIAGLLTQLLDPNNEIRGAAERMYFQAAAVQPETILRALLHSATESPLEHHKALAAVLLRRLVSSTEQIWTKVSAATLELTRTKLLEALVNEPINHIRHKLAHTITEVAITSAGVGCEKWPGLLATVAQLVQHADAGMRNTAVYLFGRLCEYGGAELIAPKAGMFAPALPAILQDPSNEVRVLALDATVFMVITLRTDEERAVLQPLAPVMLSVLSTCMAVDLHASAECLKSLVVLVQDHPMFFRPCIETAVTTMVQITNMDTESFVRGLALEFLTSLAEVAGATMRKMPTVVEAILKLCLHFLCLVEEDPEWARKMDETGVFIADNDECDDAELVSQAVSTLDRLALGVGGKTLWPIFTSVVNPFLASADWRHRRAAMLALSLVAEGCKRLLAPQIRAVVELIVPFAADPHLRVRHAAIRALSQLIADFTDPYAEEGHDAGANPLAPTSVRSTTSGLHRNKKTRIKSIQEAAGDLLLPVLINAAGSAHPAVPRIRTCAVSALHTYLLDAACSQELVYGQTAALVDVLFSVLREVPGTWAKTSALSALGSLAQVLDEDFKPWYAVAMPLLESIVTTATGAEDAIIRGRALESISMIAEAVGREVAGMDAGRILNVILLAAKDNFQNENADSFEVLMQAFVRLGNCLQADFVPYLAMVLPFIGQAASQEIQHVVVDIDDNTATTQAKIDGLQTVPIKLKGMKHRKLALDATAIATKFAACMALSNLVEDLGVDVPGFWPFTKPLTELLAANVKGSFPSIRETCAVALRSCLLSALADTTDVTKAQDVFQLCFTEVLASLVDEKDVEVIYTMGEVLSELCRLAFQSTNDGYGIDAPVPMAGSAGSPPFGSPGAVAPTESSCARAADGHSLHTKAVVPLGSVPILCEALQQLMMESEEERRQCIVREYTSNVDADEEHLARLQKELQPEDELMSNYTDIIGYCIKMHRQAILPAIPEKFSQFMLANLNNKAQYQYPLRISAMCFADDLLEWASPASHVILPAVIPAWMDALSETRPALRQCAAYGVGVAAQQAPAQLAPHAPAFIAKLAELINAPNARSEEYESSTDNVVSALVKIAKFMRGTPGVDTAAIISVVLNYLPIRDDGDEAQLVHGWLVEGIANQDDLWVGAGGANVPQLLKVLANALIQHKTNTSNEAGDDADEDEAEDTGAELFSEATMAQMTAVFQAIKANAGLAPVVATIVRGMKRQQQAALAEMGLAF